MKITQRRFADLMTHNNSTFLASGFGEEKDEEIRYLVDFSDFDKYWDEEIHEERDCVARSKDLVFCNGSHLGFAGCDCELIERPKGIVLAIHERCEDGCHVYYYLHGVAA